MERRFIYPGSVEDPSNAIFNVNDINDRSLPYRELRATDQGYFRGRNAVPWWTSMGVDPQPTYGPVMSPKVDDRLKQRLDMYYKSDGIVNDSGLPVSKTKPIAKTTEHRVWRKICEPKQAVLTEVNGQLIWRGATNGGYDSRPRTTMYAPDVQPGQIRTSQVIGQTPYRMVYT